MHVIDIKKSPLTWKGGKHWPDAGYRVKGNSDALQSAHSYISWKALFWIFREARSVVSSSFLSALVDCPGPLLLQGPTCQATPVWTLRTGAESQEGRPEWWGSSEVVRAGGSQAVLWPGAGRVNPDSSQRLSCSSQSTCCQLHCLPLTTPFYFYWDLSSPGSLQHKIQVFMCNSCLWSKCSILELFSYWSR